MINTLLLLAAVCLWTGSEPIVDYKWAEDGPLSDYEWPEGISITPPIWVEYKFSKFDGEEWHYYVYGFWATSGPYWRAGTPVQFQVVHDLYYYEILIPKPNGRMGRNYCKLGFIDDEPRDIIADAAACIDGHRVYLPIGTRG